MKTLALTTAAVAFAFGVVSFAAPVQAKGKACEQVVQSLKSEWDAIGFQTPSKPGAMRVQGKLGHENSAGQVAFMKAEIKKAEADCAAGKQDQALQRVSSVHSLLNSRGTSPVTANAAMSEDKE